MKVLIVGGGIGGLTLGAALRKRGIDYRILERTPAWAPLGAGIALSINAMRVLFDLGLGEAVSERGHVAGKARLANHRGRILSEVDLESLQHELGKSILIHRAKLHEALLSGNDENAIALGTTLKSIAQDPEGVDVTLSDDTTERYDILIGADGLRSQVRDLVFGDYPLQYSGYTCWRFVIDGAFEEMGSWEMWGRGQRFGVIPLGGSQICCYSCLNAPQGSADMESLTAAGFKKLFANFAGPAPEIMAALNDDEPLIWGDLEEVIVPSWVSGRVALFGDAAHGMTPNMGQGAAMAIEDAYVIARELGEHSSPVQALEAYEAKRRPRVTRVQNQSRNIGRVAQWQSPVACAARDIALRMTPRSFAIRAMRNFVNAEI